MRNRKLDKNCTFDFTAKDTGFVVEGDKIGLLINFMLLNIKKVLAK